RDLGRAAGERGIDGAHGVVARLDGGDVGDRAALVASRHGGGDGEGGRAARRQAQGDVADVVAVAAGGAAGRATARRARPADGGEWRWDRVVEGALGGDRG